MTGRNFNITHSYRMKTLPGIVLLTLKVITMRRDIFMLLFCIFSFCATNHCQAQQKMNARTYNKFLDEYQINNASATKKAVIMRHDTMVHPLAIASSYFVKQKVYPNEDAIRLVQELNPKIDMTADGNVIAGDTRLIFPNYPPPNETALLQFRAEYSKASSPDPGLNQSFKNASDIFNQIFQKLSVPDDEIQKKYYDSLAFFNSRILPYINNSAQSISRLQMRYFNAALTALNQTFQSKVRRMPTEVYTRGAANNHVTASYIIADFYEIANPVQIRKRSLYMEKRIGNGISEGNKKNHEMTFFYDLNVKPYACNLYIFGKDGSGNRKQDPEMEAFDVWIGDKLSFVTRVIGSAPESFGFVKMGNPASTLPIWIGLGKWIVVMKRPGTGEEYYKEISIYTETEFDPNDPGARKVCYITD